MSFDDLLALLLFLLFIVLPALNRASRNRRGTPPTGTGRAAGPAAGGARPPQQAAVGPGQDAFERRLAEARERVRQAMGDAPTASAQPVPARPSAAAPTPATATARPRTVRSGRLVASDRDDGLLSTPLAPTTVATLGRERPAPVAASDAPQARTTQLRQTAPPVERRTAAAIAAAAGFATDPETLRKALVWHQIFGEPRARRPLGGRPSTLRSR